jgi:hypothetical protein
MILLLLALSFHHLAIAIQSRAGSSKPALYRYTSGWNRAMASLPTEALPTLFGIVLGGVITQFVGPWLRAKRDAHYECLKHYSGELITIRLSAYPKIYKIISNAVKTIDFPQACQSKLNLLSLEQEINEWDNANGILLGKNSGHQAFELRRLLRVLVEHGHKSSTTTCQLGYLRKALAKLEIALRIDLGVYDLEETVNPEVRAQHVGWSARYRRLTQWINNKLRARPDHLQPETVV